AWPWRVREHRRQSRALTRLLGLSAGERAEIRAADALTPVIARRLDDEEDYIGALVVAAEQLDRRRRVLGNDDPEVAATLDALGRIAYASGEVLRAEAYLEQAVAIRRTLLGGDDPRVAQSLRSLGVVMEERRQKETARAFFLEATAIAEKGWSPGDSALAPIYESLGSHYRRWAEWKQAEAFYERALAIRRACFGPRSVPVAENALWLGHCQLCAGKLDEAERSLTEAETLLAENGLGNSHPMGDATLFLATIHWLRGDNAGAIARWRHSYACPTDVSRKLPQSYGLRRLGGIRGEWIDAQLAEGHSDEAWREVCRGSGPVTRALLEFARIRRENPETSARLDSLRAAVIEVRRRLIDIADPDNAPPSVMVPLLSELASIEARRLETERLLTSHIPLPDGDVPRLADVQARLGDDQAMIGWIFGKWSWPGRTQKWAFHAYVVRRDGPVHWVDYGSFTDPDASGARFRSLQSVEAILDKASRWPHRVAYDVTLDSLGADAGRVVFGPLEPYLEGVSEIIVAGRSSLMPGMGGTSECWRGSDGVVLGERFAFSYTPSPWAFVALADAGKERDLSLVAVADPLGPDREPPDRLPWPGSAFPDEATASAAVIDASLLRSAIGGDPAAMARLPELPWSRTEVMTVANAFPRSTLLIGPQATEASLERIVRDRSCGVLHFATHALIDDAEPDRSTLVMAGATNALADDDPDDDGRITAEEVLLGWNLDADLVTLSGCRTSEGQPARGGENLGFAQAFLASGANCLLMSRWPVDDRATALLMGRFYENLSGTYTDERRGRIHEPMSRARALQEAQLWLRDWRDPKGRATFAHLVCWAGFVLIGTANKP
ncbi:MAG TPA: CHAT domain-containing tetratricopeptide repeat protein, partial [Candidatus Eisenbacteria bacterium]